MGLGRIDKLQSFTRTCTKPTQSGLCIVGALLVLGRAIGNLNTQDSPRPKLGGNHHLPPLQYTLRLFHGGHIQNDFLSRDSQVGVLKLPHLGFLQLWGHIISCANLQLWWGLKQSCSPCQELSNDMLQVACTRRNRVDSRLLVIRSQIGNLTPSLSFGHKFCFRCPNEQCEPI
jgi:hypothetical protein